MTTLYDPGREILAELLDGEPSYRVDQVWEGLYQQLVEPAGMTSLPKGLRRRLGEQLPTALTPVTESVSEGGMTLKWLWALRDGATVETVLMHYPRTDTSSPRSTVCVSSQAGCAMACSFCATGQAGFERHLCTGEIVEQVIRALRHTRSTNFGSTHFGSTHPGSTDIGRTVNVVFMGMGEPLANMANTWGAVRRLHDDVGIGARHITISTVGLVPGIERLATAELPVNLAVSLHAADDRLRDELVPINRRWPLEELLVACEEYFEITRRRISFEWALISGVNDRYEDADRLAGLARRIDAHVNLIPLNPTPGYAVQGSSRNRVHAFQRRLRDAGVNATIRDTRGSDIDAACGQLRAGHTATPRPARREITGDPPPPRSGVRLGPRRGAPRSRPPASRARPRNG